MATLIFHIKDIKHDLHLKYGLTMALYLIQNVKCPVRDAFDEKVGIKKNPKHPQW